MSRLQESAERVLFGLLVGMTLGWVESGGHPFVAAFAGLFTALMVCLIAPDGAGESDGG